MTGSQVRPGTAAQPSDRRRWLVPVGAVEAVTLTVLLLNLLTLHLPAVAAAIGPLHGTAYLIGIVVSWTARFPRRVRLLTLLPGVGALLAARASATTSTTDDG